MSESTTQTGTAAVVMDRIWNGERMAELLDRQAATRFGHLWVRDGADVTAAINDLTWTPVPDGGKALLLPFNQGAILNDAITRYGLTNVRGTARGALPARDSYEGGGVYAMYGIEAEFRGQPQRLYVVDRGTDWLIIARDLIPAGAVGPWPVEMLRKRRGHDFYPTRPAHRPYATEDVPVGEKVIREHYFAGGADWWVVEIEAFNESEWAHDRPSVRAFGYACLGDPQMAEWGYTDLVELETLIMRNGLLIVERDLDWTPRPVRDLELPGLDA